MARHAWPSGPSDLPSTAPSGLLVGFHLSFGGRGMAGRFQRCEVLADHLECLPRRQDTVVGVCDGLKLLDEGIGVAEAVILDIGETDTIYARPTRHSRTALWCCSTGCARSYAGRTSRCSSSGRAR